jgi:hypothetical protein
MRFLTKAVIVVAVGALVMAAGRSPASPTGDDAERAAEAAVPGATAREVEHGDDDNRGGAWEVDLTRPDGATVEVDLDAGFKVLATDRDDDRHGDD